MATVHLTYLGLGSNLNDPVNQIKTALQELASLDETRRLDCSPLYHSTPMGSAEQPDYVNAVTRLETTLEVYELLNALQTIEANHGRVRSGERWGPRTLDLDILLYDDLVMAETELTIPHPGLHERPFVLYPLFDVAPDVLIPGHGNIEQLIKNCPATGLEKLAE